MRYFIDLSYCGTKFNGWQHQKKQGDSRCVQYVIEQTLTILTKQPHEVTGCGRTDTGVHAIHYTAHTDSNFILSEISFINKLNRFLPDDIVIHYIYPVAESAHARFDAINRSYVYHMHLEKSPFPNLSYYYPYKKPSLEKLSQAASLIIGNHDFFAFCKTKTDVKTTICNVYNAEWIYKDENKLEFHITADRFLRGMVRLIVGMCLDVERGKMTINEVAEALHTKNRLSRSWSVPAIGLFLHSIEYPAQLKCKIYHNI